MRVSIFALFCLKVCLASAPAEGALNYGTPYSEIGTFGGWTFFVGWDGSFSESYLPESETYAWVVYFAPEGIFVALQKAESVYSAVDVFAGVDYFYGTLWSPDGNKLKRSYIDSLLGVNISLNAFNFAPPLGSPFFTLSAALKAGQTSFRQGRVNTLKRGIQYTAGMSVSNALVPMPIPISVSLDTSSEVNAGFYPIVEWGLPNPNQNPVDRIIAGLETLAGASGTSFNQIMGQQMAQSFLTFMRTLPSSPYFKEFLESQTGGTAIDATLRKTEEWLRTGDTTKLPEAIEPPAEPQAMYRLMLPIYAGTQAAFEMGYKHGCDNNSNCSTLYADCLKTVHCTLGQTCRIEVMAQEIVGLLSGSEAADFEGAWVGFDRPFDQFLTQEEELEWLQIENGKAVFEFVLSADNPLLLGVQVWASDATGNRTIELCRRKVVFPEPEKTPIAFAGPDQAAEPGATVTLRGFEFQSPGDLSMRYAWTQTGGPTVTLSQPDQAQASFIMPASLPEGQNLIFNLTVTDSQNRSDTDFVTVGFPVKLKKPKAMPWLPLVLVE